MIVDDVRVDHMRRMKGEDPMFDDMMRKAASRHEFRVGDTFAYKVGNGTEFKVVIMEVLPTVCSTDWYRLDGHETTGVRIEKATLWMDMADGSMRLQYRDKP